MKNRKLWVAQLLAAEGREVPEGLVIQAEVLNAEPNFAQNHPLVNVQAGDVLFGVEAPLDLPVNTGWPVSVVVDESKAYLFDAETEARIAPPPPEPEEAEVSPAQESESADANGEP